MKSVIYYPYFEVQDENWLKFAALYVGNLTTIIPDEGRRFVSEVFEEIIQEKSFITVFSSTYLMKNEAADIAIDYINLLMKDSSLFSLDNWVDSITSKKTQNYEIFSQKYPNKWFNYCITNELGYKTINGVRVSKEIAYIYMYALAKLIGNKKNLDAITDNSKGQEFISRLNPNNRGNELRKMSEFSFAEGIIELKLPSKLNETPINEILALRKSKAFNENQAAFHNSLNLYLDTADIEYKYAYLDSLNKIERDIKSLVPLSFAIASTGIQILAHDVIHPFIPPVLGSLVPTLLPKSESSERNKIKKKSRQFLTDLSNLKY